jgi:hypothetical protein
VRRAASVDANQPAIVRQLRDFGCTVQPLHTIGQGCPDLLCAYGGINFLVEVKDGDKPPSKRKLTPDEKEFHDTWRGIIFIVEHQDHVFAAMSKIMKLSMQVTALIQRESSDLH